jgi:hypothetical protein
MNLNLQQLNTFFGTAALATYAGDMGYVQPWKKGFNELEYKDDEWYYRDSFCGYYKSWGQETVYHEGKPVWVQNYGGGMEREYQGDAAFAQKTFKFLKKALSSGNKTGEFQPRGPKRLEKGNWKYETELAGNIQKFNGFEKIFFKNTLVFTHRYFGGLTVGKGE